jgi:uncharacterized protein YuzE
MKYLYDSDSNSLVVTFAEGRKYRDSEEIADGVVLDFDSDGRPLSIEFLRATESVDITGLVSGRPVRLAYGSYTGPETVTGESLRTGESRHHAGAARHVPSRDGRHDCCLGAKRAAYRVSRTPETGSRNGRRIAAPAVHPTGSA